MPGAAMTTVEPVLRDLVRIEDPQFYLDDPFPLFARMRAEAPVFYYEPLDTLVLTKHEDIRFLTSSRSWDRDSRAAHAACRVVPAAPLGGVLRGRTPRGPGACAG